MATRTPPLFLGIDLGTSYFKVGLFDAAGALRGLGRVPVHKHSPAPEWYELQTGEFWTLLRTALSDALAQAGAAPGDIAGLSYSSQANTFVLLDESDTPITPLVLWTDRRARLGDAALLFSQSEKFRRTTGCPGMSEKNAAAKLRWFQQNRPETWARTRRIMTISDYFTFSLTGRRAGDASTAAILGLRDIGAKTWWREALEIFSVDGLMLSGLLPPGMSCGQTHNGAQALLGVPAGAAFAVGALDHHAAAIGSGFGRLADVSISTGTVLAAITLADKVTPMPGCYHGPHVGGRGFFRLAFDPNGAGQLEDYQRARAPAFSIEQLIALAENPGAGDSEDASHGRDVREILERIAAVHRELVGKVTDLGKVKCVVATGGGSRSDLWVQIKANALGVPIVTPASPERACLGAAMFASVAAGAHATIDAAADAMVHEDKRFEPR